MSASTAPVAYLAGATGDDAFANALRRGLERLTAPWWKPRALTVFREPSDKPFGPTAEAALDAAQWLILVSSTATARSRRVDAELRRWLAVHGPQTILTVVLDGTFTWHEPSTDFAWDDTGSVTAVPPALAGAFSQEPRHMDLTGRGPDDALTLRDAVFRDRVAELAAPLHGVTKEDLESEDVRRQRRTRLVARMGVVGLVALCILAAGATTVAFRASGEARSQRDQAESQARIADEQTRLATGRRLALTASSNDKLPRDLRLLLAAQAFELGSRPAGDAALWELLADAPTLNDKFAVSNGAMRFSPSPGVLEMVNDITTHSFGTSAKILLDDRGAVIDDGSGRDPTPPTRITPGSWKPSDLNLPANSDRYILGIGGGGTYALIRLPAGDDLDAVGLSLENAPDTTCRPGFRKSTCDELVYVDLTSGKKLVLPAAIGVDYRGAGNDGLVVPHRFTPDGTTLLSGGPLKNQLWVTHFTTRDAAAIETPGFVSDFGVIDDDRGWVLFGSTLRIFDLGTRKSIREVDLSAFGHPQTLDVDTDVERALVGYSSSTIRLIDLASGEAIATRELSAAPQVVALSANSKWGAVSYTGHTGLFALPDLTAVASIGTDGGTSGNQVDEFAFDSDDRHLLFQPLGGQTTGLLYVITLDPHAWYEQACLAARRKLTEAEWDKYVGLPEYAPACSDVDLSKAPPATTAAPTTSSVAPPTSAAPPRSAAPPAPTTTDNSGFPGDVFGRRN